MAGIVGKGRLTGWRPDARGGTDRGCVILCCRADGMRPHATWALKIRGLLKIEAVEAAGCRRVRQIKRGGRCLGISQLGPWLRYSRAHREL
jgi:hypothetical protein